MSHVVKIPLTSILSPKGRGRELPFAARGIFPLPLGERVRVRGCFPEQEVV